MPTEDRKLTRFAGFDALRIVAALAVVLTHSFELTGFGADKPVVRVGRVPFTLGTFGVGVFFVTSGFLVAKSWERSSGLAAFARHRVLRIWPALLVLVIVLVTVVGPLMTTAPVDEYFRDPLTRHFAWKNAVVVSGPAYFLPSVFRGQPSPLVDGSLWTLSYEVYGYAALAVLGLLGVLRRGWLIGACFVTVLALDRSGALATTHNYQFFYRPLSVQGLLGFGAWFLAGALLAALPDWTEPRRLAGIGAVAITGAFVLGEPVLVIVGMASLTVGFGMTNLRACAVLHRWGDPSYGIYIFAFPIQQVLYHSGAARSPAAMFAFAAPIAIAVGYLSWHAVERPALRLRDVGGVVNPRTV